MIHDFYGNSNESGENGDGWSFTNFAFGAQSAPVGRWGVTDWNNTGTIGVINHLRYSAVATAQIHRQDQWQEFDACWAPSGAARDFDMRFGISTDPTINPPASGVYLEALAADTNWFIVTRNGGVQTRTDSLVAVALGTFVRFRCRKNGTSVEAFVNQALIATLTVATHNVPAATVVTGPTAQHIPTAANPRTIQADWFYLWPLSNFAR
jgi:hypothetical protein